MPFGAGTGKGGLCFESLVTVDVGVGGVGSITSMLSVVREGNTGGASTESTSKEMGLSVPTPSSSLFTPASACTSVPQMSMIVSNILFPVLFGVSSTLGSILGVDLLFGTGGTFSSALDVSLRIPGFGPTVGDLGGATSTDLSGSVGFLPSSAALSTCNDCGVTVFLSRGAALGTGESGATTTS